MGRFGDTLLVAGEPELALTAKQGEVVRVYLTNTANTRVFKVALPGARMKLVGGDSGRVRARGVRRGGDPRAVGARRRRRAVRAARRARAGAPHAREDYRLGTIAVGDERAEPVAGGGVRAAAHATRSSPPSASGSTPWLAAEPDKTLAFVGRDGLRRARRGTPRSTSVPCTPRSSPRSRATARAAA